MSTESQPQASYAEGPGLPARSPEQVDPEQVDTGQETRTASGLVPLGAADGVVCEDGYCWVPPAEG